MMSRKGRGRGGVTSVEYSKPLRKPGEFRTSQDGGEKEVKGIPAVK